MRNCDVLTMSAVLTVLLSCCLARADQQALLRPPSSVPTTQEGGRSYEYMALDSYANPVSEEYCPPAPPAGGKFSVFGFLSMMVSISVTVANILNAINNNNNNNNNDNNDNNNNDNNNNNNDLNGDGGEEAMQDQSNMVPVRINQVGQNNANADLGAEGAPVLTGVRPTPSNPNTISFAGKQIDFTRNRTTVGSPTNNFTGRPDSQSPFGIYPPFINTPHRKDRNVPPQVSHRRPKSALNQGSCSCRSGSTGRETAEGITGHWWRSCLAKIGCDEDLSDRHSGIDLLATRVTQLVTRVFTRRLLNDEAGRSIRSSSSLPCSSHACLPLTLLKDFIE
ncbi:transcription initiation factor TFIID subunit 1-like [Penaeus japonicus]|uniref:transcription initiation factor TFIID subunit 1-like n=1 Tax=Penaeus japonicus TaxID=27405 RepID=UPI001C717964|nr:transcription initiation factor TFIID subunit 1-like [Penaeus japonicus]